MNRPDQYIAQLTAQAAWLRAQGDHDGAALAEELADHFNTRHEGVLDVTTPEWANEAEGEVIDAAPSGWVESVHMARAEAREDAEREDYDATVGSGYEGEAIDAEFEETPDEVVAAQEAADPFNIDPPPGYGDAVPTSGRTDTSWPAREYMSDDVDIEPNRLRLDQGGNGDWYLAILKPNERMGVAVRITTSGTRSSAPDMPLAVFKLYQAMGGERIGLSAAFGHGLDAQEDL